MLNLIFSTADILNVVTQMHVHIGMTLQLDFTANLTSINSL